MIYIFIAMIFYSAAVLFITVATRRLDSNFVTAVTNVLSVIIPVALIIPSLQNKISLFAQDKIGLLFAIIGGVLIALFGLALNKAYSTTNVAVVVPIVFGGSIFLTAILSNIFLKEKITTMQGAGLLLLAIGIVFIIYSKLTGK